MRVKVLWPHSALCGSALLCWLRGSQNRWEDCRIRLGKGGRNQVKPNAWLLANTEWRPWHWSTDVTTGCFGPPLLGAMNTCLRASCSTLNSGKECEPPGAGDRESCFSSFPSGHTGRGASASQAGLHHGGSPDMGGHNSPCVSE